MRRICAWCNKEMHPLKSAPGNETLVTHSICTDCADNLDFQLGVTLQRYLDSLKFPIIALDGNGQVVAVNAAAAKKPAVGRRSIAAHWVEKIYECAHARLPHGCRTAVHCSGCAIRLAATDSYATGKSSHDIPAHLNHCSTDTKEKIELLISTDNIDGIVFLRLVRV